MSAVVEETEGFVLVGCAASGEESIVAARVLRPDLILMDVNLPGIDGMEATRRLREETTAAAVVLLSTYDEDDWDGQAEECGADRLRRQVRLRTRYVGGGWSWPEPSELPCTLAGAPGVESHGALPGQHAVDDALPAVGEPAIEVGGGDGQGEVRVVEVKVDQCRAAQLANRLDGAKVRDRLEVSGEACGPCWRGHRQSDAAVGSRRIHRSAAAALCGRATGERPLGHVPQRFQARLVVSIAASMKPTRRRSGSVGSRCECEPYPSWSR